MDCQLSRQLSATRTNGQIDSPFEVFNSLVVDAADRSASPLPGPYEVFSLFRSNHMESGFQDAGTDGLAVVWQGYGSQAGSFWGSFLTRFDSRAHEATLVLASLCLGDGERITKKVGGDTHLYSLDFSGTIVDINTSTAAVVASFSCDNCQSAIPPSTRCDNCGVLVDGGDVVIAVRQWGTRLAATTFEASTDRIRGSVVLAADGRVVVVPGQLWTVSPSEGLVRWDPATGARLAQLNAAYSAQGERNSLVADQVFFEGGSFWTYDTGASGRIEQHNPDTFAIVNRLEVPGLATVAHGGGRIWFEATTGSTVVNVAQVDPANANVVTRMDLHSFLAKEPTAHGDLVVEPFVPEMHVDDRGFWFETIGVSRTNESASATSPPDIGQLRFWGAWKMYRWEPPQ